MDMDEITAGLDIACSSSSWGESFSNAIGEAMACGKPIVATYNGGSEEIITSEDYGLLCEPANPEKLAEKILIALDKEWDCDRIREYAEQFTWENIVMGIMDVYEKVIRDQRNDLSSHACRSFNVHEAV